MRAKGISPNKIAQTYNDEGIVQPGDYKEQKFGIPNTRHLHHLWSCGTVKQVLNNPTYLGHLVQMRTTTLSYKNKKVVKRNPEETVWVRNTNEAIVDQELWDKFREMEVSVSQGKKSKTGIVNPLSGLVYCADYGTKMQIKYNKTRHSRKGPRIYYRENFTCGAYSKFGKRACSSHYIQLKVLTKIVLEDIRSKMQTVKLDEKWAREEFLKRNGELLSREYKAGQKRLNQTVRRIAELDKMIASVYEDRVAGRIPEAVCFSLLESIRRKGRFDRGNLRAGAQSVRHRPEAG